MFAMVKLVLWVCKHPVSVYFVGRLCNNVLTSAIVLASFNMQFLDQVLSLRRHKAGECLGC